MYGNLVIGYLFLGGAAAGGLFAMAAWSLLFDRTAHSYRHVRAFEALQARVYTLCLTLLVLAIVFLLWDLAYPERALLVLLRPHPTPLTFGAYSLVLESVLAILLVLSTLFRLPRLNGVPRRILEAVCCMVSLATMAYTGVFLTSVVAVAFWNSWWLVAVFVCSSLSCGVSLLLLVDYFIKDQTLLLRAARPLQKCHLACLAAEAVTLALFVGAAYTNPAAHGSWELLLSPALLPTAVVGVLGFGMLIPAILETYSLTQKECRTIPVSDVICLCGGLCLRYVVIACGVQ